MSENPGRSDEVAKSVLREIGLVTIYHSPRDIKLLYLQRFVPLFAYGSSTLILVSYLAALGIGEERAGLFMTLTLAGDVLISFALTLFADRMGRRTVLALGSLLMTASGVVFGISGNYWVLLVAAIFGVISPSGNEIGPFRAVEESAIAHLVEKEHLGDVYAWYALVGTGGTACGIMVSGWLFTFLNEDRGFSYIDTCRVLFYIYAGVGLIKFMLTLALSRCIEREPLPEGLGQRERQPLLAEDGAERSENALPKPKPKPKPKPPSVFTFSRHLQRLMLQLCLLFALDSFASGLAPMSWVVYFIKKKFSVSEGTLGSIFFSTSIISAASTLCAVSIARRISNVQTMVFTHLPSAICLSLIGVPSTLWLTLVFLVGRACTQSMDVAPRSAFLASILPADSRTAVMGIINVVKTTAQSVGPAVTGLWASSGLFWISFVVAGCLKATYDVGMLITFATRNKEEWEEEAEGHEGGGQY